MHSIRSTCLAACLAAASFCDAVHAAPHAHEHGVVRLSIAVEGDRLTIGLDAPLDSLLGFERAPRSDAEKKAASEVLGKLSEPAGLFKPTAEAGCKPMDSAVDAPVLQSGTSARGGHADLQGSYVFQCTAPDRLKALQVDLFDAFKRIRRIDVQVAGPRGQSRSVLRPGTRSVALRT
jgi:hypothetical protein